jgi:hypothetical protein
MLVAGNFVVTLRDNGMECGRLGLPHDMSLFLTWQQYGEDAGRSTYLLEKEENAFEDCIFSLFTSKMHARFICPV